MKKLLFLLISLFSLAALGQSLPLVVDNSHWFPPAHDQRGASCTHFSLIYNLKSAIWNKEFNRDPSLPENQFSYGFAWVYNVPEQVGSDVEVAAYFMQNQGCATVADYPLGWSYDNMPDLETRTKALFFKSKSLSKGGFWTCFEDKACVQARIQALKDSLAKGKCFVLGFPILPHLLDVNEKDNVYHAYKNMGEKIGSHAAAVVGYNDTIKTAHGRGAFIIRDSSTKLSDFFFDYNWFYFYREFFGYYFLEEDFSSAPKVVVNAKIKNSISLQDILARKFIFVDTTMMLSNIAKKFDFIKIEDYFLARNHVQAFALNGRRLPLRNNWAYSNYNTPNDSLEIVFGLPDENQLNNFTSFSLIVFDPVSANYIGEDGKTIYSYVREPETEVESAAMRFLEDDKRIIGKVIDLPDTTIVETDFYSMFAGMHLNPYNNSSVFVKSCTSVLRRKLVTFSIKDLRNVNKLPIFVEVPQKKEILKHGENFSFQFKADDPEDSLLHYSIIKGSGATINPESGWFSFQSESLGNFPYLVKKNFSFTIRVSDGEDFVDYDWSIEVANKLPPVWTEKTNGRLAGRTGVFLDFRFQAACEDGTKIYYSLVNNSSTQPPVNQLSDLEASIDAYSGLFSFKPPHAGSFPFTVEAASGWYNTPHSFVVEVTDHSEANQPPYFSQKPNSVLPGKTGEQVSFQFKAEDPEGQAISYVIIGIVDNGAKIDRQTGLFTFSAEYPGTYNFKVRASDLDNNIECSFSVEVERALFPPVFINPVDTLFAYCNQAITHQFKAYSPLGRPVIFTLQDYIFQGSSYLMSVDGLLTFQAWLTGTYDLTVIAGDGWSFSFLKVKVIVSVFDSSSAIEKANLNFTVFPNPVANQATFRFLLPRPQEIDLKIFNIAGQALDIGAHLWMPAGEQSLDFDLSSLISGVYLCRFSAGDLTTTFKIIKK